MTLRQLFRRPWLVFAALVLAGAAVLAGSMMTGDPAPRVIIDGYTGEVLVSPDGRTLTLGELVAPCEGTAEPVLRESAGQVALGVRTVEPVHGADPDCTGRSTPTAQVVLGRPLGARAVVAMVTGERLSSFDERRLLRPAWLPAGVRLQRVSPELLQGLGAPVVGCRQEWAGSVGGASVSLLQFTGRFDDPAVTGVLYLPGVAPTPTTVRGQRAFASVSGSSLEWQQGDQVLVLSSNVGNDLATRTADLQRIAASVA